MTEKSSHREWYAIVNPNAGNGKGNKDWGRIASLFGKENIALVSVFTDSKGHAAQLAGDAVRNGFRRIISVGGDGTLNEVVNGIYTQEHCSPSEITIGMIPVGTGNDWGRMFGIPLVYEGAVDVIRENKTIPHDIGMVSYHEGSQKHVRYFINIAGLGFEALVVKKTNKQKDKGRSSQAIYFYNLLSSLISYRKIKADITIENKRISNNIFSINVGNGKYCGGGMRQTPDALPDDGLFDITIIRDIGKIEVIKSLKLLYDGTILSHPKVDGYRSDKLLVESESTLYLEADGETLGHTPVEFTIIPAGINIVYGTRLIQ